MLTINEYAAKCVNNAWVWLCLKYCIVGKTPEIQLSKTCRFAKFYPTKNKIRINLKDKYWNTYYKKSVTQYASLIPCTIGESITLQAVHELTHVIQFDQKRKYSEVETTKNEIEYAKEYYPYLYKQLKTIN